MSESEYSHQLSRLRTNKARIEKILAHPETHTKEALKSLNGTIRQWNAEHGEEILAPARKVDFNPSTAASDNSPDPTPAVTVAEVVSRMKTALEIGELAEKNVRRRESVSSTVENKEVAAEEKA